MDETNAEVEESETFAAALAAMKRDGSVLLTTGASVGTLRSACQRLLGDTATTPRRRLFVLTEQVGPDHPARTGGPGDHVRTLNYRTQTRSAATTASGPQAGHDRIVTGDLSDLYAAIEAEVTDAERDARNLEPAQLRVCLDSLDTVLAAHGQEETFTFLHEFRALIRGADGMAHVHLPAAMDDAVVGVLTPLFDAVIEVREGPQQRWHLREPEFTTDWLSL
ncbi:MAG: hypothetical protein ABEJ57_05800 [Halobacteriaceae archaeon]